MGFHGEIPLGANNQNQIAAFLYLYGTILYSTFITCYLASKYNIQYINTTFVDCL